MAKEFIITNVNGMPVGHGKQFGDEWAATAEGANTIFVRDSMDEALEWCQMVLDGIPNLHVEVLDG